MRLLQSLFFVTGLIIVFGQTSSLGALAAEADVADCDRLAGAPRDMNRVTAGVALLQLDASAAIAACEKAREELPHNHRILFQLARAYQKDDRVLDAVQLYEHLAAAGYQPAQYNLAVLYYEGSGVVSDHVVAAKWFKAAAELGDADAAAALAMLYQQGDGVPQDFRRAFELFQQAATSGVVSAQVGLANAYAGGIGAPVDLKEAVRWYSAAADAGDAIAENELGGIYELGAGVDRDLVKAVELYRKSADQSFAPAEANLGRLYAGGIGIAQDFFQAAKLFRSAAEHGNAWAKNQLGELYRTGRGVEQDYARAIDLYRGAAAQGDIMAMGNIGYMHANGLGTPKDLQKALKWYTSAAEAGNIWAMSQLGYLYESGRLGSTDGLRGYIWYKRAVDGGSTASLVPLAKMLVKGIRTPFETMELLRRAERKARHFLHSARPKEQLLLVLSDPRLLQLKDKEKQRKEGSAAAKSANMTLTAKTLFSPSDPVAEFAIETLAADQFSSKHALLVKQALSLSRDSALAEAGQLLQRAIESGLPEAALQLAKLHLREVSYVSEMDSYPTPYISDTDSDNLRFSASASAAAQLYRAEMERGSNAARTNLAQLYELGRGVPKNLALASELYRSALNWPFNGRAHLGLIRISLSRTLEREKASWQRTTFEDPKAANGSRDLLIECMTDDLSDIVISDPSGRRLFAGPLKQHQLYRVPSRDDLTLWAPSHLNRMRLHYGGQSIDIPPDRTRAGIRLDRTLIEQNRLVGWEYGEYFPPELNAHSKLTVQASTRGTIYIHDDENLFGIEEELSPKGQIRIPDIPNLKITMHNKERIEGFAVSLLLGQDRSIEIKVPPNCLIELQLDLPRLHRGIVRRPELQDCGGLDPETTVTYLEDLDGRALGTLSGLPDEEDPSLPVKLTFRGLALMNLRASGRTDQRNRAARIFLSQDLRRYGPNSFKTIESELELADSEIDLGSATSARARLDTAIERLNRIGSAPDELAVRVYSTLGSALKSMGRYVEARNILIRALLLQQRINRSDNRRQGAKIPRLLKTLSNLAERLGDLEVALALELEADLLSDDSPEESDSFNVAFPPIHITRIIDLLRQLGRYEEVKGLLSFAHSQAKREFAHGLSEPLKFPLDLRVFEQTFGPVDHSGIIADALGYLGQAYVWMGRPSEAVPLFQQLVKTRRNIYGEGRSPTVIAVAHLSGALRATGDFEQSLALARSAFSSAKKFAGLRRTSKQQTTSGVDALKPAAFALLEALHSAGNSSSESIASEAFEVAQHLQSSSAALALQAFGERLSENDATTRELVRARQDLADQLGQLDASLIALTNVQNVSGSAAQQLEVRRKIAFTEAKIEALDTNTKIQDSSLWTHLSQVRSISYSEFKQVLAPKEALVVFAINDGATFVFVATRETLQWYRTSVSYHDLQANVAVLRCGLDIQKWLGPDRRKCEDATGSSPVLGNAPFAAKTAHSIYKALLSPAEPLIRGRSLIFVLPDPLGGLPPSVWLTEPPTDTGRGQLNDYVGLQWLIRAHTISVVPSIDSMFVIRKRGATEDHLVAGADRRRRYIGFADPALAGNPKCPKPGPIQSCAELIREANVSSQKLAALAGTNANQSYFRGSLADVTAVRELCPLHDTEREISCVSKTLRAPKEALVVGTDFTESKLKKLPLEQYRIIHFATHGLLADEARSFGGITESALVLTPPKIASPNDDGLLTASEIAQLKLNADWVVLSACNTAGANVLETDALSGLARAFFFAGARTLLASHWAVDSGATVALVARTLALAGKAKALGPAEALRASMLAMIDNPALAHPSKWAPFIIIGESRALR
ncbi:CHAT domain-containing protein [Bradyrhizobium pachyrhizi]|uniref:CHAT domain-containing protein n=1 Tax=Bradyrhizobium pachyrhizi TaxID=280333 RepID=UPI0024B24E11|nr:CHAT domain-containing protein [Bradyrhizobium pachyrhizi]WFU55716.1 CHAT domain-containing protein [Bradyrhizobium pachyrhizi]